MRSVTPPTKSCPKWCELKDNHPWRQRDGVELVWFRDHTVTVIPDRSDGPAWAVEGTEIALLTEAGWEISGPTPLLVIGGQLQMSVRWIPNHIEKLQAVHAAVVGAE